MKAFERAILSNPTNALAYIGQGETLCQLTSKQNDPFADGYKKALAAFEQAISLDETNARAYVGKGKVLLESNYYFEAKEKARILKALEQAINLDSKNTDAYIVKGDAFTKFYEYGDAAIAYEEAIKAAAFFNRLAHIGYGNALYELGLLEDAIKAYDRIIQEMPEWPYAHKQKGDALNKLERYEEALDAYGQAVSLNYPNASVYTQKGNTLYYLNHYQEALAAYERAIQLGSNYEQTDAYKGKGNVLQSLSKEAFKKADEVNPLPDFPDE